MPNTMIDVPTRDGVADAYLTKPEGDGPFPGVLLLIDAFGLRPQIEQMADRIAARGFVVLAPNLFYRAGRAPVIPLEGIHDPERRGEVFGRIRPMMQALDADNLGSDAAAYLDVLQRESDGEPIAITGYCFGGRAGWAIAAAYPDRVAALGGFHAGGLVTDAPDSPHLSAGSVNAELYFGFADNDQSATPEQIATLRKALDAAGVTYQAEIYQGAQHGYTMADTPVYDEAAAERHYTELFALLDRTIAT